MGCITWFFYLFAGCFRFPAPLWLLISLLCIATAVTEGLVYQYMFTAEVCDMNSCKWGTGAKCGISAMTFWSLSALMTCGVFKDAHENGNRGDE
jgi:hypothetical protein